MVCNTDPQALRNSPVPVKVRLGQNGLGAGNNPEKGRQAALESLDDFIGDFYKREGTKMVFITAGMEAWNRNWRAPVIARAAGAGIPLMAIVTFRSRPRVRNGCGRPSRGSRSCAAASIRCC